MSKAGIKWRFPDLFTKEGIDRCYEAALDAIHLDSHPGWPFCGFGTNKKVLLALEHDIKSAVILRVRNILDCKHDFLLNFEDPTSWLRDGLRDPHRIFTKNELKPARKKTGRIVCGESIVDQLVHRMFFSNFSQAEAEAFPAGPNMKGVGFNADKACKIVDQYNHWTKEFPGCSRAKSDVGGWEKGYSLDCADSVTKVMLETCENPEDAKKALEWWKYSLISNLIVDDDGNILQLNNPQMMKSGNFLTNSGNGIARLVAALLAGSRYAKTNGDDCYEFFNCSTDHLKAAYSSMNIDLRDFGILHDEVDFCSHTFGGNDQEGYFCYLDNWQRTVYDAVIARDVDLGSIDSWCEELLSHPDSNLKAQFVRLLTEKCKRGHVKCPFAFRGT